LASRRPSATPPATTIRPLATPAPAAARGNGMRGSARHAPPRSPKPDLRIAPAALYPPSTTTRFSAATAMAWLTPIGRSGSRLQASRAGENASTRRELSPSDVYPPRTTISLPTAAADTSVRGSGSGARASHSPVAAPAVATTTRPTTSASPLISDRFDLERQAVDSTDDDRRARNTPGPAACPPDLAA